MAYEEMVRQAVAEIQRRLDDPPDFRELAANAFVSAYHFHRIFDAMVGESPRELCRRLRLERAAYRLRDTDSAVAQIAAEAGYATPEAFAKAFQSGFEVAPSVFRTDRRDCLGLRTKCGLHYVEGGFTEFHPVHKGGPEMKVDTVELGGQRVAAVEHLGAYWQMGKAFAELGPQVAALGLTGQSVAAFYDDPQTVSEEQLRSIAGVIVSADAKIGGLREVWLPGGRYLIAEYVGHYSGLPQAWASLYREHLAAGGYQPRDEAVFEVYVSTHDTEAPDKLQTDLYLPIF